ncbi:biotin/lipoyl-containing protein [Actomonas aquatica]|uniref:Biotin/lipoyl-containing protein n=1 Tax=Actomonas aquatica TaxID=2866162 RepID=A0ABZ1CF43_9BACT|nr:biotin/lipoyl-containing protein [Opitutus sp. WL0086]WRQ90076.1 biotin/lipoyl-containing protein [Opitutus sp. WL0086]
MRRYQLVINDQPLTVTVKSLCPNESRLEVDGVEYAVRLTRQEVLPSEATSAGVGSPGAAAARPVTTPGGKPVPTMKGKDAPGVVRAPIPGAVLDVFVRVGDAVKAGQALLKMEAMKMENTISAPVAGKVTKVDVAKDSVVEQGGELLTIE